MAVPRISEILWTWKLWVIVLAQWWELWQLGLVFDSWQWLIFFI